MKFSSFKKAFSLVVLSVVVIIIGIFIAGATQGAKMLNTFRLQSAQTLTLSSPVISTSGLVLWLEPTMPQSFLDVESVDGAQITKWIDRNPQATIKLSANSAASAGIIYKEQSDIYGLPAVAFSGSSSAVLTLNNGSANVPIITPSSAYTLFVVAKLSDDSSTALKTVFSNGDSSGWGYGVSGVQNSRSRNLIFAGSTDVTSATPNATTKAEVISALYAGGAGGTLQLFTNGVGSAGAGEAGTSESLSASTATATTPTSAFYVGNKSSAAPWTGLISEIIIFNRALSTKERNAIELYLGQKYNIKTAATGNIEGCPVNIAGVTQTHVGEGASSLPCLASGYTGNVSYDCSGGTLTPGGSCAPSQCAIFGVTGLTGNVNYGTTLKSCDAGYTGNINYTCSAGGSFSYVSGSCTPINCTISGVTGFTGNVNYGTTSKSCDAGYTGDINYTCSAGGIFSYVSGSCTPKTYRWVAVIGSSAGFRLANQTLSSLSSGVCNLSNLSLHAITAGTGAISGSTLSGSSMLGYFSCYCLGASCSTSCGSNTRSVSGYWTIYRCDYN